MKKSVMMIMGSHRKHKNTAFFSKRLETALKRQGFECIYFDVNQLRIEHCTDCGYCNNHFAKCIIEDDMKFVYDAFRMYRHVIILSPVYMNNITSKLKTLVDRCQMIFMCDFTHKKPFVLNSGMIENPEISIYSSEQKNEGSGTGIIVSLGGARAYENQFLGSELTISLILKNLRIPLKQHIQFSGTDHLALESRLEEVDAEIGRIIDEVVLNESKI